jgi:hypothetical protein
MRASTFHDVDLDENIHIFTYHEHFKYLSIPQQIHYQGTSPSCAFLCNACKPLCKKKKQMK